MDLTVLALHGLTSTTKVWSGLAAALPQARIVAPDLAGGGSAAGRRRTGTVHIGQSSGRPRAVLDSNAGATTA